MPKRGKEEDDIVPAAEPAKLHVETDPAEVIAPSCSRVLRIVIKLDIMICAMLSFTTFFFPLNCTGKHRQGGGGANKTGEQGENKEDDEDEGEDEVILLLHPVACICSQGVCLCR